MAHYAWICVAEFEEFNVKPTIYSYNELKAATRDFHEENKLGQGGYGAVYKVSRSKAPCTLVQGLSMIIQKKEY